MSSNCSSGSVASPPSSSVHIMTTTTDHPHQLLHLEQQQHRHHHHHQHHHRHHYRYHSSSSECGFLSFLDVPKYYNEWQAAIIGFVPGAVGGFCNVVVGHPLDLIKVRQQCLSPSSLHAAVPLHIAVAPPPVEVLPFHVALNAPATAQTTQQYASRVRTSSPLLFSHVRPNSASSNSISNMLLSIVRVDGIKGLYAGVSAPLLAVVPAFGITFWSFDMCRRYQLRQPESTHQPQQLTIAQTAIAGAVSGVPLALVLGPLEKIKCEMQLRQNVATTSTLHSPSSFSWRTTLFRGTGVTMARDVPGNAMYFASYEYFRRMLHQLEQEQYTDHPLPRPSMGATMLAGGLAGVCNWIIAIPMDVIKSQWQTSLPGTYRNPVHVAHHLMITQGPSAFVRGLGPAILRAFPANAACLWGVETARQTLDL